MTEDRHEWATIRAEYEEYRDRGLIGVNGKWSWYDQETAELRVQEWLTFLTLLRRSGLRLGGKRIVDVGCGDGRWLRWCLDLGVAPGDAIGIDLLDWRIDQARGLAPNIDFRTGGAGSIDLPSESAELGCASLLFSSIGSESARLQMAAELERVVCRGGYIYLYDLPRSVRNSEPIRAMGLFPDWPLLELEVKRRGSPASALRPLRGMGRIVGGLIRNLGYPPSHFAALLGPKK